MCSIRQACRPRVCGCPIPASNLIADAADAARISTQGISFVPLRAKRGEGGDPSRRDGEGEVFIRVTIASAIDAHLTRSLALAPSPPASGRRGLLRDARVMNAADAKAAIRNAALDLGFDAVGF